MIEPIIPRHTDILAMARASGRVTVDGLANNFNVTPQTIRKDLKELCDRGLLNRVHGGAVIASAITNYRYESRRHLARSAKKTIATSAAELIPNSCSVMISIGTSAEQVAMALRDHDDLMVITNNIHVINILSGFTGRDIVITGGVVRHADSGVVGEAAIDFIRQFKVDYAVIGTSAIDSDGTLFDFDYREVTISRTIMECARHTILVADASKFERTAPVRVAHISGIDSFITDKPPSEELQNLMQENNVNLVIAPDDSVASEENDNLD